MNDTQPNNLTTNSRLTMRDKPRIPIEVKLIRSTDLELPKLTTVPKPLVIRRGQVEESDALATLCGRAYPDEVWDLDSTKVELFQNNTVKAVLVVADTKRLLATASLQVHSNTPFSAQVRWVATELKWRRHGFARALVTGLLKIAKKEGCKDVYLHTTTNLLGAISLYIQLGFVPAISSGKERDAWTDVFSALGVNTRF